MLKKESMTNFDEMISKLDGEFKHNLDRYKYPNRYEMLMLSTQMQISIFADD